MKKFTELCESILNEEAEKWVSAKKVELPKVMVSDRAEKIGAVKSDYFRDHGSSYLRLQVVKIGENPKAEDKETSKELAKNAGKFLVLVSGADKPNKSGEISAGGKLQTNTSETTFGPQHVFDTLEAANEKVEKLKAINKNSNYRIGFDYGNIFARARF